MKLEPTVHVVAGAVVSEDDVLVALRPCTTHYGGYWEFPGGKVEAGETRKEALSRELKEEIGITPTSLRPLIRILYQYPDRRIDFDVWRVEQWKGDPFGIEQQEIRWRPIRSLRPDEFPPADLAVLKSLQLPDQYAVTPNLSKLPDRGYKLLCQSLDSPGRHLVQLRTDGSQCQIKRLVEKLNTHPARSRLILMLNSMVSKVPFAGVDGLHLTAGHLMQMNEKPSYKDVLIGASCHNCKELAHADMLGLDFAVLSPVKMTTSHLDRKPLGWASFSKLIEPIKIPIFALGGLAKSDLATALDSGAQGVAGISNFW